MPEKSNKDRGEEEGWRRKDVGSNDGGESGKGVKVKEERWKNIAKRM